MRRWILVAAVVVSACRGDEPPPAASRDEGPPPWQWSSTSLGGRFTVRQVADAGRCRVTCTEGPAVRWTADVCAGSREDLAFLAPDGDTLLVLHPLPAGVEGADWSGATVAHLLVRGKAVRTFTGGEWVAAATISALIHDYSWARGVHGSPGRPPRLSDDGRAVVVETADGATLTVSFDGAFTRAARAAELRVAEAANLRVDEIDDVTTWRWEDAEDGLHFAPWHEVPERYRSVARRVTAQVGTVTADPVARRPSDGSPYAWMRSPSSFRSSVQPPPAGPRLNGLTDAERAEQEAERARVAKAKADEEARGWERQREFHRMLDRRGMGPPPFPYANPVYPYEKPKSTPGEPTK